MIRYLLILLLVIFSAFFSGSEIAFSSINEMKLRMRCEENSTFARRSALFIGTHYDSALITILIGNNIVNIFTSSIATLIAYELLGESGAWIASAIITIIIITFGEVLPKIVASKKAISFATFSAIPLKIIYILLFPFVWIFKKLLSWISKLWENHGANDDSITEDDLETMIDTAEDEGVVSEDTADLLQGAMDFGDLMAKEVMVPRVDMEAVDIDDDPEEIKTQLFKTIYTRVPVYEDTIDNIVGILNMKDLLLRYALGENVDIRSFMKKPLFVHGTMTLDDVLSNMRKKKNHIAIVTDEYGGVDGLITMEDILEQIVGEIWDEQDVVNPEFEEIGENLYSADGDMRIFDLFEELDVPEKDFDDESLTLGGFAVEMLNDYAKVGDKFSYKNLDFEVTEADERRVNKLTVKVNSDCIEEDNVIY